MEPLLEPILQVRELVADCIEDCEVILSRTGDILESELYTLQTLECLHRSIKSNLTHRGDN